MKENNVTIDDWDWCIDDGARLIPWFSVFRELEHEHAIKSTEETCLFRVGDAQKHTYLVKHFYPNSLADHLIAFFSAKAKNVYDSAIVLHSCGIPCADYPGWAKNGTESMTITEEIPDTETALEYWFHEVTHNTALRREFVTNLAKLVMTFVNASVTADTLSLEHILIGKNGMGMYVLNPHNAEKKEGGLSPEERMELLAPFMELRGEISSENIAIALLEAGFCDNSLDVTEMIHDKMEKLENDINEGAWPEFAAHVLAGESGPLCRVIHDGENELRIRNTIWYSELPVPDDNNSTAEDVCEEDAEKIWIDSFKAQLLRHHCPRIPLSWERRADGHNILRYANSYDDILACGFNQ